MALREILLPWDSQPQEAVGMFNVFGRPLFGFLPTAPGRDLSGNNCPIAQDTASRVATPYGIGCTFASGKWLQYDATKAGGGTSDTTQVTRVYIVQYGAQGYQWLSYSSATGSSEIIGTGWNTANLNCQNVGQDIIIGTVADRLYVIVIRANLYGQTTDAWVNGVFVDSWTSTDARSGSTVYLGRRSSSDAEWFTGKLLGAYTLSGLVTNSDVGQICSNPWQVFEPRRIYIPGAAAGGTPGICLLSDGSLAFKSAAGGTDRKVYWTTAGQLEAKLTAGSGDKLLTMTGGQLQAT